MFPKKKFVIKKIAIGKNILKKFFIIEFFINRKERMKIVRIGKKIVIL